MMRLLDVQHANGAGQLSCHALTSQCSTRLGCAANTDVQHAIHTGQLVVGEAQHLEGGEVPQLCGDRA